MTASTTKKVKAKKLAAPVNGEGTEMISRLSRQEVISAARFNKEQAAALVGMYYSIQKTRIGAGNKVSAHEREVDVLGDEALILHLRNDLQILEKQTARALESYAKAQPLGQWALSNIGVGPISAASLLAHIDFTACGCREYDGIPRKDRPYHNCPGIRWAGCILRFAGLDPTVEWEAGKKRPYNAALKVTAWKIGESFKKTCNHADTFYGRLYKIRKEREVRYNEEGRFKEQALSRLEEARRKKYRISEEQKETWASGKLQPAGLDLRAMRYAVTIFLSHYHQIGRELTFGEKVMPWIITKGGHGDYIPPPNWPMV